MSSDLSNHTISLLAQSLPLVDHARDALVQGIEIPLRSAGATDEAFGQSEVVAMILVGMLIEQAHHLTTLGGLRDVEDRAEEHRALGISGRHYSRFGDALVPVLRDVLGQTTPSEVTSAWVDTFWRIIRALTGHKQAA